MNEFFLMKQSQDGLHTQKVTERIRFRKSSENFTLMQEAPLCSVEKVTKKILD